MNIKQVIFLFNCISRSSAVRPLSNSKPFLWLAISILCMSIFSSNALAQDASVNRLLASQCAQCHGPDGKAVAGMEKLTDESSKDLYEDLRDMRKEDNPENIMDHQALGYSDDQIRRIAAYFGSLSAKNEDSDEDSEDEDSEDEDSDDEDSDDEDEDEDERD